MPPHAFTIRRARLPKDLAPDEMPYVPDTAPVVETRSGVMTRVWLEWARRVTGLAAAGSAGTGGGVPDPHAPTHEPGGADPLTVDAAPGVGSLRTLGSGANQAAPGNDPRFTPDTPVAHHVTHEPGGADALAVDAAAAVGSLRTLGTGASQAAPGNDPRFGASGPHHATHEPGGGDALVNAAWTNVANTFTQDQKIQKTSGARLILEDLSRPVDARQWRLTNASGQLVVIAANDAGAGLTYPIVINRDGHTEMANLTVDGTTGNVACKDQANTFTQPNTFQDSFFITRSGTPGVTLTDTSQPANQRIYQILNYSQFCELRAVDDAFGLASIPLRLNRSGDVVIGRDVYEKARTTPMGHRIDVPFSASNFTGNASMVWTVTAGQAPTNYYTLIGNMLFWSVFVTGSTLSGTASNVVKLVLPNSRTSVKQIIGFGSVLEGGVWVPVQIEIGAGGSQLSAYKHNLTNFTLGSGTFYLAFQIAITFA